MIKTLRKYNKLILVIFGSFLLVVFLLPQGMSGMASGRAAGPVVATMGDRKIRVNDLGRASRELDIARQYYSGSFQDMALLWGLEPSNPHHWIMLVETAKRAGLVGASGDGRMLIEQFILSNPNRDPALGPPTDQEVQQIALRLANELGVTTEKAVVASLANIRGVNRLANLWSQTARSSLPRTLAATKHAEDTAIADALFIPGEIAIDPVTWNPSQEELAAHFERFRDVDPEQGEFGIGYRLGDRLVLEVMEIPGEALRAAITPDPVEVRKRYDRERTKYPGDFAAERAAIEREMIDASVADAHSSINRAMRAEYQKLTDPLRRELGWYVVPADIDSKRKPFSEVLDAIVVQVQDERGFLIPRPTARVLPQALDIEQLRALPGLGSSSIRLTGRGNRPLPMADVLMTAKELQDEINLGVQRGLPLLDPAVDQAGNLYYVTILEVRKASPAESIDVVRDRVSADLRRLRGYEKLAPMVPELLVQTAQQGLASVAERFGGPDSPLPVQKEIVVSRNRLGSNEPRLNEPELRDAIVAASQELDFTVDPSQAPVASRTVAKALPKQLGVGIAVVGRAEPLTEEAFRIRSWSALIEQRQRSLLPETEDGTPTIENFRSGLALDPLSRKLRFTWREGQEPKAELGDGER